MVTPPPARTAAEDWPALPLADWQETYATLHLWTQVVGKIRLALAPMLNHWWQATLYLSAQGLTTGPVPYGTRSVQIDFDFVRHRLRVDTSDARHAELALAPRSVAAFYAELTALLRALDVEVRIWTQPVEIADAIPFEQDLLHSAYDADAAQRCWRVLLQGERVLQRFRSGFLGKSSPVHFFWGSFDLALTRFSGRRAPPHPGGVPNLADWVTREAYSHEVSSCGFWPGGGAMPEPAFYAYAYPEPPGYREATVQPTEAFYHPELGEFVLPYEAVRQASDPDALLLAFCESTYAAAATLGAWDRAALER